MLRKIKSVLTGQHLPRERHDYNLSDPTSRQQALTHRLWVDHGFLRYLWTNFAQVADGVYRSNQPDRARLTRYCDMGINGVFNLRGVTDQPPYLLEAEDCAALGLEMMNISMSARKAPPRKALLEMFAIFDSLPKPFVMHCKSGADRAGLASALYLLDQGAPLAEAQKQMSLRFLHLKFTRTGIQDMFLEMYGERLRDGPITIRDWVRDEYNPEALTAQFAGAGKLQL